MTTQIFSTIIPKITTGSPGDDEGEEEEEEEGLSITAILTPQLIIALIALILNSGIIVYFLKKTKRLRLAECLLFSLAVADGLYALLTLVNVLLLFIEHNYEVDSETVASITGQFTWFSVYASIFHLISISLDRVVAVMFAFKYKVLSHKAPIKVIVAVIWVFTAILQGSIAIYQYKDGVEEGHEKDLDVQKIAGGLIFTAGILLFLIYSVIIRKILTIIYYRPPYLSAASPDSSSNNRKNTKNTKKGENQVEIKACLVALLVTIGFVVFTFPIAIFPFVEFDEFTVAEKVFLAFQCLLIGNSVYNPIVYFWRVYFSEKSRKKTLENRSRNGTVSSTMRNDSMITLSRISKDTIVNDTF